MTAQHSERPVILVVDSDPVLLTGTAAVLHSAGYESHCARDSQAALKAARTLPIDLIVCDVNLNGESGLELCRHIRRQPGCIDTPVMFVSNQQLTDIVRRNSEAGAAYFLRKPFDPNVLIELVGKALWMPNLVQNKMRQDGMRIDMSDASRSIAHPKSNMSEAQSTALIAGAALST